MMLPLSIAALAVVHPVAQVGWTSWTIHWSTVIGLAALGGLYLWGARHVQARAAAAGLDVPALRIGQRVAFFSGLLVIFASLNGPLHDLSDYYLFCCSSARRAGCCDHWSSIASSEASRARSRAPSAASSSSTS
jgi:hypothetical protein